MAKIEISDKGLTIEVRDDGVLFDLLKYRIEELVRLSQLYLEEEAENDSE
jgi:hypothetical protein